MERHVVKTTVFDSGRSITKYIGVMKETDLPDNHSTARADIYYVYLSRETRLLILPASVPRKRKTTLSPSGNKPAREGITEGITMERISWRNVKIYDEDGNEADDDVRREKLAEYRRDGSIDGPFWLVDPSTHGTTEGVDEDIVYDPYHNDRRELWNAGPAVEEIDWTGFDEAYEVVIDRISEPYGKGFSFVTVHYHFEQNGMSTGDGGQTERITIYGLAGDDEAIREHCQSELEKMNQEG